MLVWITILDTVNLIESTRLQVAHLQGHSEGTVPAVCGTDIFVKMTASMGSVSQAGTASVSVRSACACCCLSPMGVPLMRLPESM